MLSTQTLLHKYDVPGPRYTSYPTVPVWTEKVGAADYANNLQAVSGDERLSLYFHLPFCENLCHFCGCMQVITKDHTRSAAYVGDVLRELALVVYALKNSHRRVSQLHFGGGTPNFLQPEELSALMQNVRENFVLTDNAEVAIEMHPHTSTRAFCDVLAPLDFNRISLGVQSFDERVQHLINRHQTFAMTKDMMDYLCTRGQKHFNIDLIYGLPGQTPSSFADTLEKTLKLKPNRLAVYAYAHVPWVRPVQRSFKDSDLPTPSERLNMLEMAFSFLPQHGYHPIGLDHFADENDELTAALKDLSIHRNFMGYSTQACTHQIGLGVSSISYVNGNYFQNSKKIGTYQNLIRQDRLATFRGHLLTSDDHIRRATITELMCHLHIDKQAFAQKHGITFDDYFREELPSLHVFAADGLLRLSKDALVVTASGHLVLRNIAMVFDRYLPQVVQSAQTPVFSQTV